MTFILWQNQRFKFLFKKKKFLEDVHSSSSSTSFLNNNNNNNQAISLAGGSNAQLLSPQQAEQSNLNFKSSVFTSSATKIEPGSNLHIIETRIDANEIINQIETELSNRLNNLKSTNKWIVVFLYSVLLADFIQKIEFNFDLNLLWIIAVINH